MAIHSDGDGKQGTLAGLWLKPTAPKRARQTARKSEAAAPGPPVQAADKPGSASAPWSVRALVNDLRQHVEAAYADLWVEGEISNCRAAPSGHVYLR